MISLTIQSTCIQCDSCRLICPENAVIVADDQYNIDNFACTLCNLCVEICPESCIRAIIKE